MSEAVCVLRSEASLLPGIGSPSDRCRLPNAERGWG